MEPNERTRDRASQSEMDRRWSLVRSRMAERKLDALLVGGTAHRASGPLIWLTGLVPSDGNVNTVIFPADGLMTLVEHGIDGGESDLGGRDQARRGVGRRLSTNSHIWAVSYTDRQDADLIVKELQRSDFGRIGLVAPSRMYAGVLDVIRDRLPKVELSDFTDVIDDLKAVKSAEELEFIRRAAALQDQVMAKLQDHIRPGLCDFEVTAYAEYIGKLGGSDAGIYLGSSSPPGIPASFFRQRANQGRRMQKDDLFQILVECAGPGGYYTEIMRTYSLGKAPNELVDATARAVQAQHDTLCLYQPGARCGEIFHAYNDYMRKHGMPEEKRLHSHSQGIDLVERPLVRPEEELLVRENMNFAIHPEYATERFSAVICDNFIVGPNGPVHCSTGRRKPFSRPIRTSDDPHVPDRRH